MNYGTRDQETIETIAKAESVVKRLFFAVEILCTGKGDVRSRLIDAMMELMLLKTQDFPAELQQDFNWIYEQCTKYPARWRGEGTLHATMYRIQNRTGEKIASRVFNLYRRVQEIRGFPLLDYRSPRD